MYRIQSAFNGVIVSDVATGSRAESAVFEKGDITPRIEYIQINNTKSNTAMAKYKNKPKRILVYQQTGIKTIVMDWIFKRDCHIVLEILCLE
ncbi:hypothetical protein CCY99_03525 [Helicobacter sp. 16-1353]|uniref:hypothetical protein n=1 Tax=Helicobacter sp. 16-1353 TaxID=2004996 RepID=UPI000DCD8D11|nr:hypothetical protein [Helicobacter sp. 16-1353]RAX54431.1 hypothetical protein CCY99_03525 [Helicobacter sp. 16-1353]